MSAFWLAVAVAVTSAFGLPGGTARAECQFSGEFKALRDLIPGLVGACASDPLQVDNGDTVQITTGGMLVRRQSDGRVSFTDGTTLWLNGPNGLLSGPSGGPLSPWQPGGATTAASTEPPTTQAGPPPVPSEPSVALDQLVLSTAEAGEKAKSAGTKKGSDGRASWYEITYRRDSTPSVAKLGPQITINRVYRANDAAAAAQIFQEQVNAGLPEAKPLNLGYDSLGPQPMDPVGEAGQAVGACGDCNSEDKTTRHYRVVFRIGNVVETLYTYGLESGNNFYVVFDLAKKLEHRVNAGPAAPLPEITSQHQPAEIALGLADAGKEAVQVFSQGGSDGRASWHEVRFERGEETIGQKLGPNVIYNKVFVANSLENARAIYAENAVKALPEANQPRSGVFVESKTAKFGNESFAIGACNTDCDSKDADRLHERLVYRWGNVVVILYIWGRDDVSNPTAISTYGGTVTSRIQ